MLEYGPNCEHFKHFANASLGSKFKELCGKTSLIFEDYFFHTDGSPRLPLLYEMTQADSRKYSSVAQGHMLTPEKAKHFTCTGREDIF